jgi:hypothetical protein
MQSTPARLAISLALIASGGTLAACRATNAPRIASPTISATSVAPADTPDPTQAEITLPSADGWRATLVLDQGTVGVWTVLVMKVFQPYGCPEIVGLDDKGRLHALWSYSGKWTPVTTIADGTWLGGIVQADLDPRVPGAELYTGSQAGNLYEVVPYRETLLDNRRIVRIEGREIHTLVAGDFDASHEGLELIAFTQPGALYMLRPREDGLDGFDARKVQEIDGRIRDAALLPVPSGSPPRVATVGRHGRLEILEFDGGEPRWITVYETRMGMGRVAIRNGSTTSDLVLYTTCDDGRILRHASNDGRVFRTELIYAGHQGPRGVAAGRFDADPAVETIAVFGYSQEVELLSKRADGWHSETLFEDRDKGHWLAAGELDGRNSTDEIVASGYSGRVVLLSRAPGYGLGKVLAH